MAIQRSSILVSVLLMLAACGGGGGGSSGGTPNGNSPPPASPTAEELTKAQNAKLRMRLDVPNLLLVSWVDTFDNEQSYKVERRAENGTWQTVATVPAFDGGSGSWEGSILDNPGTYRVSATFRDYSLPLHAEPGVSEIDIDAVAMTLAVVTAPEPTGGLRASVRNATPAQSVTYFTSGIQLANVTSGEDFATTVPFQRLLPMGLVVAEVHKSAGLTLRARTPLPPASHNEPALVLTVGPSPTSAALLLTARAYSPPGIASVQFFANGQLLQRLDSPDRLDNWIHAIDPASLTSNVNTFRALATDADGATVSMDVEHTLETSPALTVEGLFDGMIASGDRLNIRGTFGENVPGTVLSIDAGYRNPVFRTRTSPFNFDYPIAGLSSWREMTIRAESPTGQVSTRTYFVVLPSTGRSYELIATDAARLLAADAGVLLYQKRSGAVVMRDAAGVETPFQVPTGLNFSAWYLANGKVIAQERLNHRMHAFVGPGQTVDLLPWWIGRYASLAPPVLRGNWLAFTPGIGFAVYNLTTGATTHIEPPAGTLYLSYDIDATASNERLLFPADIDGTRGIYSHSFVTDTTELLATGAYDAVRTDGARLVARSETAVLVGPLNNPAAMTTLSSRPSDIVMKDGWLCYRDDSSWLAVDDGVRTVQLSETGSCDERSIADGHLVFVDGKGINSWNPTAGKQLVLDASAPMMHTQGVAYLLTGRDGALYRTTLP